MEVESQPPQPNTINKEEQTSKILRKAILFLNFTMLILGSSAGPLILRLYFLKGGSRIWLSSWLQTGGWPIILIPLAISYYHRRHHNQINSRLTHHSTPKTKPYLLTPPLFVACTVLGILTGLDDLLYAYGVSYLPVSTSSLLISTQLGFTALFAFLLVKQKFTAYSMNSVALLTFGAVVLGIHTSGDRPKGESGGQYYMGFFMCLGAAALYGLVLPLVELMYGSAKQTLTYTLVMEMQLVMSFFATVFCTVGMVVNKDFQAIPSEAKEFELGEARYYVVLGWSAILLQFFFLGAAGVIFNASALVAGIIVAVLIPVTEVLAVIFFHESFTAGKGVALALSLWGLASYFYGEFKENKRKKALAVEPEILNSTN